MSVTSVRRVAARVTVACPGCHERRELTARQARQNPKPLCRDCRFPVRREPPDDADRLYWLARFSDEEIVEMATAYCGRGDAAAVATWRAKLAITARR